MTCIALNPFLPASIGSRPDTGVSDEAKKLRDLEEAALDFSTSWSIGEPNRLGLEALREALEEATSPEWLSQGATPVEAATVSQALSFLRTLPASVPPADIMIHPDGEIAFEWFRNPRMIFTVSIASNGRLSYAGLFGHRKAYGTEYFGENLPEAVAANLRRFLSFKY